MLLLGKNLLEDFFFSPEVVFTLVLVWFCLMIFNERVNAGKRILILRGLKLLMLSNV